MCWTWKHQFIMCLAAQLAWRNNQVSLEQPGNMMWFQNNNHFHRHVRFGFVLYWSMIFIYGETCNIVPCNLVFHEFFIMIYNWWRAVEYTYCRYWYWKCLSCKICSRYVLLQLFELRFYSIPHWVIPRRYTSTENCKRSKYIHGAKLHNKLLKCI